MSIDPLGGHVLSCKKDTGCIRGHNRHMDELENLACAFKIGPVRVNNKVSTTGDDTRKQGDIKITNFFISHCDGLVVDVSLVCEFRGSSRAPGGWNNGEHYTHGVLQARANIKTNRYSEIYGLVTRPSRLPSQVCQVRYTLISRESPLLLGTPLLSAHLWFDPMGAPTGNCAIKRSIAARPRLLWVLADKQTQSYYERMGMDDEIRNEAFRWARAKDFNSNQASICRTIAFGCHVQLDAAINRRSCSYK